MVPFYNEEDNVAPLAERVAAVFAEMPDYEYECLFVNDGSKDSTRTRLETERENNPRVRPIHLVKNRESAALVAGMRHEKATTSSHSTAICRTDPCDFPKMLDLLKTHWLRVRISRKPEGQIRAQVFQQNWQRRAATDFEDGIRYVNLRQKGFRRKCVEHIIPFNGVHRYFAVMMRNGGMTIAGRP